MQFQSGENYWEYRVAIVLCVTESGLLSDVAYVMCLDSVGSGSQLFMHVSKPPKNDSAVDFLLKVCRPSL